MITIRLSRNYEFPDFKRQTPNQTGIWKNIQIVEENISEADFLLILNQPAQNINIKINKHGKWLIIQEPPYDRNKFFKSHFKYADSIISGFENVPNNIQTQAALPWHINKTYDELKGLHYNSIEKENKISWITSNINLYAGHQDRIDFIKYLQEKNFSFDLFGRGFKPIDDKYDGLARYKYSIAVENFIAKDYWTEKAIDCMLSWTIPIYFGCPNFEDYFPRGSFISLDIRNKEAALDKLNQILISDYWENHLEPLSQARQLILDQYQIYPTVKRMVDDYFIQNPRTRKKKYYIPFSGLSYVDRVKLKLRSVFKK